MVSTDVVLFQREPHVCEIEVEGEHLLDPFELLRLEHWKFARLEHVMKDPDMFQIMKDEASRAFREIAKKCHPDYDGTRPILGRVMDPHRLLHQLDKAKRILTSKGEFSHFVSQAFAQTEKPGLSPSLKLQDALESLCGTHDSYLQTLHAHMNRERQRLHGIVVLKAIVGRFSPRVLQAACSQDTSAADLAMLAALSAGAPVTDATRPAQMLATIHEARPAAGGRPARAASVSLRAHGSGPPVDWPGVVRPEDASFGPARHRGGHSDPEDEDRKLPLQLAVMYLLQGYKHLAVVPASGVQVGGGAEGAGPAVLSIPRRAHLLPPKELKLMGGGANDMEGQGEGGAVVLDAHGEGRARELLEGIPSGVHPLAVQNDAESAVQQAKAEADAAAASALERTFRNPRGGRKGRNGPRAAAAHAGAKAWAALQRCLKLPSGGATGAMVRPIGAPSEAFCEKPGASGRVGEVESSLVEQLDMLAEMMPGVVHGNKGKGKGAVQVMVRLHKTGIDHGGGGKARAGLGQAPRTPLGASRASNVSGGTGVRGSAALHHRAAPGSRARPRLHAPGTGVQRTVVRTARRAAVARGRACHAAEESRRTLDLDLGLGLRDVLGAGVDMEMVGAGEGGRRGDGGLGLPLSCNASVASSQTASALHEADGDRRQRQREAAVAELAHSTDRLVRVSTAEAAQDRAGRCMVALPRAVSSGLEPVALAAWLVVTCVLAGWRAAAKGERGPEAAAAHAGKAKRV